MELREWTAILAIQNLFDSGGTELTRTCADAGKTRGRLRFDSDRNENSYPLSRQVIIIPVCFDTPYLELMIYM